jgi:uncharacterized membrane protein
MLYLYTLAFVMSVTVMGIVVICWLDFKRANDRKCHCSVCTVPSVNSRRHEAIRKRHGLKGSK